MYIARGVVEVERYLFRIGLTADGEYTSPSYPYVFEETLGFELSDTTSLPDGRKLDAMLGMDVSRACDFTMLRDGRCRRDYG